MAYKLQLVSGPGVGKTQAALSIARWNPDSTMYYLDTDGGMNAVKSAMEMDEGIGKFDNVHYTPCRDFGEALEWRKAITPLLKDGDWATIDMTGAMWQKAQDYFIEKVYGVDPLDYILLHRQNVVSGKAKGPALDGMMDWPAITKLHAWVVDWLCYGSGINAVLISEAAQISMGDKSPFKEDPAVSDTWARYRVKPEGQKRNTFKVDTSVLLTLDQNNQRYLTVVKGRGFNVIVENQPYGKYFWPDFLDATGLNMALYK